MTHQLSKSGVTSVNMGEHHEEMKTHYENNPEKVVTLCLKKKLFGSDPVKTGILPLWVTGGVSGTLSAATSGTGSVGFTRRESREKLTTVPQVKKKKPSNDQKVLHLF